MRRIWEMRGGRGKNILLEMHASPEMLKAGLMAGARVGRVEDAGGLVGGG